MRKIFCALTLSMLSFLTVYCGDFDEKKPFGSTYSEPIEVGDFLYCLRSDGYYQCIGLSNSGFEAQTLMIPDYINGIPTMGFGIPCEDTTYSLCYHGQDIPLEYTSLHEGLFVLREKVDGNETGRIICHDIRYLNLYTYYVDKDRQIHAILPGGASSTLPDECKCETLYINCHHVNGIDRVVEALNYKDCHPEFQRVKKIVWEPNSSNESCYKYFYGFFKNAKPGDRIDIVSPLTLNRINEAELYLYEVRKQFPIYDDEEYIKTLRESSEIIKYWGMTYAEKMEEMKSRIRANIEFRYNLYINGNLYVKEGFEDRFDEEYDERDLYWIDYVNEGETIQEPLDPYIEGYKFLGWYTDSECTTKWDFSDDCLNSPTLKLYAKWDKIK